LRPPREKVHLNDYQALALAPSIKMDEKA
jgi:hypothetical protein